MSEISAELVTCMLRVSNRVDNKRILALQILIGFYLAALFFMQSIIYDLIYLRIGLAISNEYPVLTGIFLYVLTAPLAIILSNLLSKSKILYDTALQAGLIANYTFVLIFAVILLLTDDSSIFAFIGFLFFGSIFGFALSAVSAALYEKISLI